MMPKMIYCCSLIAGLLLTTNIAKAQDPHFASVQDMNIWYNPALKTNKVPLAHVSFRNVKYPNIISYNSKAITFELPFVNKEKTDYNNIPFVNLAFGINTDNSSNRFLKASTAMLSLSYALPLNENNTYISIGWQANYSFNQVGADVAYQFPDQFDKYGALSWALKIDPYTSGLNYEYFTAGAGLALFHSGDQTQWYIGASIRHFNHPYTEWSHSSHLASSNGIQAGYLTPISGLNYISGYANLNWQAGINEQSLGTRFYRHLNDSTDNSLSLGVCYRAGDGLVPDAGIQIGRVRVAFYYEFNIVKTPSDNFHRKTSELSFELKL